ncbi:50S ribosomal protein L23 [soil metagenome]
MQPTIIIKPLISEKSVKQAEKGSYCFAVLKTADKPAIKLAVQEMFSVEVTGVMTSIIKPGKKRVGSRRIEKSISSWKKALVTLKAGQKIDLFNLEA